MSDFQLESYLSVTTSFVIQKTNQLYCHTRHSNLLLAIKIKLLNLCKFSTKLVQNILHGFSFVWLQHSTLYKTVVEHLSPSLYNVFRTNPMKRNIIFRSIRFLKCQQCVCVATDHPEGHIQYLLEAQTVSCCQSRLCSAFHNFSKQAIHVGITQSCFLYRIRVTAENKIHFSWSGKRLNIKEVVSCQHVYVIGIGSDVWKSQ